jgi:glucose-fructose oxidoreductase
MPTHREPLIRIGVIGLGHFAQVAILPAFRSLRDVELAAVVSGTEEKRVQLGKRYGVPAFDYDELDAALDRGELDAVYIALPPDLHAVYAVRCARRGVHVLCEKPMAPSERECRAMIDACDDAGVQLMIAYRLHFEAANLTTIELAQGGTLGDPRTFSSTFAQQVREDNVRTQPRPGAGPLWDMGIYCINAARYVFRAEPYEVSAMSFARAGDPRFAHIPEQVAAVMRFPDDRCATFVAGFGAHDRAHYEVVCTKGAVALDNAYEYVDEIELTQVTEKGTRTRRFPKRDQIAAEIEYFARCVRDGVTPEPSGYEGLADVRVIEAIERSAETGHVERLEPIERQGRPGIEQEIHVRAHGKPKLVGVASASR